MFHLMTCSFLIKMYFCVAEPENRTPWYMVVFGILLVVFAGCTFTGANVIQKIVCQGKLNFWSLFLIRGLTQLPIMAGHVFLTKGDFVGPKESRSLNSCFNFQVCQSLHPCMSMCVSIYLSTCLKTISNSCSHITKCH